MDTLLKDLISFALEKKTSDIHFLLEQHVLKIEFRTPFGLETILQDIWDESFFEYLKFISRFDLTNPYVPQSGQFMVNRIPCRFSVIINQQIQTGVLRILNVNVDLNIDQLTNDAQAIQFFHSIQHQRMGLYIHSGPTNSGKTTTLHAILHEISLLNEHKIVSLEDPIEIEDKNYLQLQINEAQGFTYEKGIEELLRHDPDVIFIGETRNAYTARMVVRAALTGHLVFTTIHAKNGLETIERLNDFGVDSFELKNVLSAIISQRLYQTTDGKECIYEILSGKELQYVNQYKQYPKEYQGLSEKINDHIQKGIITDQQAFFDLQNF